LQNKYMPSSNRADYSGPSGRQSDSELVALLKGKAPEGFTILYNQYAPALYGVALRITSSRTQAEDIVQKVLAKAWLHPEEYDPARESLFTWLLNLVRHAAIDCLRSSPHRLSSQADIMEDPSSQSSQPGSYPAATGQTGSAELPAGPDQDKRLLLEHAYLEGFTRDELAHRLGMPSDTVPIRLRAALLQLRALSQQKRTD
jgi:RNA polymerase sigma-70 factor (ECF subfamily)